MWLTVVVIITTVMLQMINQNISTHTFTYDRSRFIHDIYWQWITPSLVHANWSHWLLNILNLLALMLFFHNAWTVWKAIFLFCISSFLIMLSVYYFSQDVMYYVGMSGVLYTFAVYGAFKTFKEQKTIAIFILLYILVKLFANDWINHFMMVDIVLDDLKVITDVHEYGAILGFVWFALEILVGNFTLVRTK